MELKQKVTLKTVLSYLLAVIVLGLIVADVLLMRQAGVLRSYLPNGVMWNALIKSLTFGSLEGENGNYLLYFGIVIYLAVLLFVLVVTMSIIRKKARYLINAFTALFGLVVASSCGAAFLLAANGTYTTVDKTICMVFALSLLILGFIAFIFGMAFPNGKYAKSKAVPNPVPVSTYEVPQKAAEEVKEAPAAKEEPVKEEKPAVEEKPAAEEKVEEKVEEKPAKTPAKPAEEKKTAPKKAAKKPAEKPAEQPAEAKEEAKEEPAPEPVKEAPKAENKPKVLGKYEVFPEAGFFKYRLKANNGEILIVSNGYKSQKSAVTGIDTFKKNVPTGLVRFHTDKNGYAQWRLFTGNDSRLIASGEIYPNENAARSAYESVLKFYETEKVNVLESIPDSEVREWQLEPSAIVRKPNGKLEIYMFENKWKARLLASNGQVLFHTSTYSSRSSLLAALSNIKEKATSGLMTISCDKQNRYQFRIFSENGMLLVNGESYASKDSAISACGSVRNFLPEAKLVDATKVEDDE